MKRITLLLLVVTCSILNLYAQDPLHIYPKLVVGAEPSENLATPDDYSLFVTKGLLTERVRIAEKGGTFWADFVFKPSYYLRPLSSVETFIKKNGHLPDVPSAKKVAIDGFDVADTQRLLLQKIEELTLYIIQQEKRMNLLEKKLQKYNSSK